jgi:hypothetical protein
MSEKQFSREDMLKAFQLDVRKHMTGSGPSEGKGEPPEIIEAVLHGIKEGWEEADANPPSSSSGEETPIAEAVNGLAGMFTPDEIKNSSTLLTLTRWNTELKAQLTRLQSQQAEGMRWISVKDKPPIGEFVLFYNGHWRGVGKWNGLIDKYDGGPLIEDLQWEDEISEYICPYPTHWMPLPSAPHTR